MKNRVCTLYRVSTDKQVDHNDKNQADIPMQRKACHAFCEKMGWVIVHEEQEEGVSGHKVRAENRDKLQIIKELAKQKKFDILLVFMFDRIGRIADETPFVVEWFVKNGIEVWSTQEGEQRFDSHTDKLTNYIRFWQADGESEKTSIRTKTALGQLVEGGGFKGGLAPYGYDLVKSGRFNKRKHELYDLVVNETEAAVVRIIFDKYVHEGFGAQRIATYLNKQGYRARTGKMWHHASIRGIVCNLTYTGVLRCGESRSQTLPHLQIIPPELREEIFKPFVQYRTGIRRYVSGTGIGLSLATALAGQLGGRIYMDKDEEVNRFILELPLRAVPATATGPTEPEEERAGDALPVQSAPEATASEGQPGTDYTLMLVEDNEDMAAFIAKLLRPLYRLVAAANGEEALERLKEHSVHLIVSDIMMPVMDGMELCRRVKTSTEYSHIPLILLTAKSTLQSKIEGIRSGADAYIEKPFSADLLLSTIASLLKSREQLRKVFSASPFLPVSSVGATDADKCFLQKLAAVTEENISNEAFSVDVLAEGLGMSRSSLNRKLKGVLDMTPNDYIRQERLRKAYRLLKEGYRSNEACLMVGFNTPSYFARCFQQQFGISPKDLQKNDEACA